MQVKAGVERLSHHIAHGSLEGVFGTEYQISRDIKVVADAHRASSCFLICASMRSSLPVIGIGKTGANIGFEHDFGTDTFARQHKGCVAHDLHDLVPVALDLGEHRGGAVRKATLADDAHDLGDLGG